MYQERLELVLGRIAEIAEASEHTVAEPYADYFVKTAGRYLLYGDIAAGKCAKDAELNKKIFEEFVEDAYATSYANPAYAVAQLGEEYGRIFSVLYTRFISTTRYVFEGDIKFLCLYAEFFVELYNSMEEAGDQTARFITENLYSFVFDNAELFMGMGVHRLIDPEYTSYFYDILMNADLSDSSYLYRYPFYVGENETKMAAYLNTFSEEEIQSMADTYTEGYRMGFVNTGKDLTKKSTAEIRYPIGFERIARAAAKNFAKMNLQVTLVPSSTPANKQFDYDHKEDDALWLDKPLIDRSLEVYRAIFEEDLELSAGYAGPAVMEVFGEVPFSPETKEECVKYSAKQQQLSIFSKSETGQLINKYIHGEERSFTIIAYPVPSIGEQFEEIFAETVKLNTLDYMKYQRIQQCLIDALDTADRVHILGANGNKTDLYVKIYPLANPEKETAFENCVADVNIPVGEVFTSPVLTGTTGKLHVSQVYLRELNYIDLEIDFKDGMISSYTCKNFEDEEENKKYIKDNVMSHHDTLPMGEFAIGTNTTAYRMARVYDIAAKLPILIAEKTGPHFAVGDTCYHYDEDNITYNPDGKAIVARDNEVSILRKTDVSKAYYNCHTDITIPYDELGRITAIRKDGTEVDIIVDGRFVLAGTEELNKPLDEM